MCICLYRFADNELHHATTLALARILFGLWRFMEMHDKHTGPLAFCTKESISKNHRACTQSATKIMIKEGIEWSLVQILISKTYKLNYFFIQNLMLGGGGGTNLCINFFHIIYNTLFETVQIYVWSIFFISQLKKISAGLIFGIGHRMK